MRLLTLTVILLAAGLLFADPPKVLEKLSGKVVGITDGDTISVLIDKESIKVRLEGIDAPESGQSYGKKSKQALSEMVFEKSVTVNKTGKDRYGRTLGVVIVDELDVNAWMIEEGWAWHYTKYNDEDRLAKLEVAARTQKRGLWADDTPLAPWEFRARKKAVEGTPKEHKDQNKSYWLNTSSGVRHNQSCEHYHKTKKGRSCGQTEGQPCGICGG